MNKPNFLIIGVQKSGTTWLYNVIKEHPEVGVGENKEIHFFDRYYDRGLDWYMSKFHNDNIAIGEATPDYIFYEKAPKRIYNTLGSEVKLICVLRDPIERAFSAYKNKVQKENYSKNFEEAIEDNPDILKRGLYYKQIKKYTSYFDLDNIKIIIFEDLINNKEQIIKNIFEFINVQSDFESKCLYKKYNVSKIPKFPRLYSFGKRIVKKLYDKDLIFIIKFLKKIKVNKLFFIGNNKNEFKPIENSIKKELKGYYKKDVEKLSKLTGKNLIEFWDI